MTTRYQLIYHSKPDLRLLFPLFSVGYVRRSRDASTDRLTFHSTSIRCLCIGRNDASNQLEFIIPPPVSYYIQTISFWINISTQARHLIWISMGYCISPNIMMHVMKLTSPHFRLIIKCLCKLQHHLRNIQHIVLVCLSKII